MANTRDIWNPQQIIVMRLRYDEGLTQAETAKRMAVHGWIVSQQRVAIIERNAIRIARLAVLSEKILDIVL
jgi:transcriptional regulator with XRE-family HTH domain